MLKNINAVIFDMDGVVFDSEKTYHEAFIMAAAKHEIEVSNEFVHQFTGKITEDCLLILQDFFKGNFDKTQHFFSDWNEARLSIIAEHGIEFKEGFIRLFNAIKASNRSVGLVTSAIRVDVEENFSRNNSQLINKFDHIVTIEDVQNPKPHPQPYQKMIRHLNQQPENCIVIEDSIVGITAAITAGANTIMINENMTPPVELKEKIILHTDHHDNILLSLQKNGL